MRMPVQMIALAVGLALGGGCVEPLDVSQPIDLVPGRGWSAFQRQVLQDAAECWNVEFGTRLSLTDAPRAAQRVRVAKSDFVCAYANGLASYLDDLEVQICSIDAATPSRLLTVMQHELGHVLNIREHADDPHAVMSESDAVRVGRKEAKRFQREDRELFQAANPDFRPSGECAVARLLGQSPSRPLVIDHPTRGPLAVIAGRSNLVILGAGSDGTWREVSRVPAAGVAGWIRAAPTPAGLIVTWVVENAMYKTEVRFGADEPAPSRITLEAVHDFEREVEDLTIAVLGPDLYVGITEGDLDATFFLYRFDSATGEQLSTVSPAGDTWGRVHAVGSHLALAIRDGYGVHVVRYQVGPFGPRVLTLEPEQPHNGLDSFGSEVVGGDLVVIHRRHEKPLGLYRVGVVGELRLLRSSQVALPGKLGYTLASVAEGKSGLALAVNRVAREVFEVYVSQLDPDTLDPVMPWTRLSTPDLSDSVQPWLAPQGGRFMAVWRDVHDQASIEVRSRCF